MTRVRRLALALLATLGTARTAVSQTALADSVRQAFHEYEQCLNAGEYARLIAFYADDPRFYWVEHGVVSTRHDMARELSRMPPGVHLTYDAPRITIVDAGVALLGTRYTGVMGDVKFSGYMTITLIRTPVGWRFLAGHS